MAVKGDQVYERRQKEYLGMLARLRNLAEKVIQQLETEGKEGEKK